MPSTKKRINITVPDAVYQQLRAYMDEQAIESDATACLQLIKLQLKANENSKAIIEMMKNLTSEQLAQLSSEGLRYAQDEMKKLPEQK